jgi:Na+-translocating ferredoxin:NAD+ oxidoreductase RNF subunit RnfB
LAVFSVTVIGVLCSIMLAVASKVMAVETDDTAVRLRECLPGANCGACGFAGCDGYAAALASGAGTATNLCIPGGDPVSRQLGEILGVGFVDVIEQIAVVHCCGHSGNTGVKMEYQGVASCSAVKQLYGGRGSCSYGCLGFGDCAAVCPNGAICIEDGLARINTRLCTGCGLCARACPNGVIYTNADSITTLVTCSNLEKGAAVRKKCSNGCIGCHKCERECPDGAITVVNNLARIDYSKCGGCGRCAEVCTTKCIQLASFAGIFRTEHNDKAVDSA